MGATSFADEYRGTATMLEAYAERVQQAFYDRGHDAYNGTISTTHGVIQDPAVKAPVDLKAAMERAQFWEREDRGEPAPMKWDAAWAVPLLPETAESIAADPYYAYAGVDRTQPGWLFYGLAAC